MHQSGKSSSLPAQTSATTLIIEDNALTRKLVRFTLENKGYTVLEAHDAASALAVLESRSVDLILQDLKLPDMDGFELVSRLRALPSGPETPILAFSGLLSKGDEARMAKAGFDGVIAKPIEPKRLLPMVEAHLHIAGPSPLAPNDRKRLVLADDEPLQLKLSRFRLEALGYLVETATDGRLALAAARRSRPDAIVSDVLMPNLDGFGLAVAVRSDPDLAHVPVLLVTSTLVDESDRELARRAGATNLVLRTPSHRELFDELQRALEQPRSGVNAGAARVPELEDERFDRMVRQLERQVSLNSGLAQRCSTLAAELAVIGGISEAVVRHQDVETALDEALAACLDVGGISFGALYLLQGDGSLRARPLARAATTPPPEVAVFWGHEARLRSVISSGKLALLASFDGAETWVRDVLAGCSASFAMIVPLIVPGSSGGALFMAMRSGDIDQEDWRVFAQAIASQVAQALALANAFSEKEVAEQAAYEHAEKFRATFEHAPLGVAQVAIDGRWLDVNQSLCDIVGYSRTELLSQTFQDITYPPDLEADLEKMQRTLDGETRSYSMEKRYVRKDGSLVWVDLTVALVRDSNGHPKYFVPIVQDVTARKKAEEELEQTSAQLRQAQKMEAVGQLAGGIAHDFNNVLSVIQSYGELLLDELPAHARMRADLEQIVLAGKRAANLTRQLLAFSRQQVLSPCVVELNGAVKHLSEMLKRLIGEHIELSLSCKAEGRVYVDPGQLEQVIMNLTVNARDAMPRGGRLSIETADVDLDGHYAQEHLNVKPGRYAMLAVSDTGVGMDRATQSRIFEPFFTTKEPGKGTGLGLSTVFGIVSQSQGAVWVYSELGRGTTFKVYLPHADTVSRTGIAADTPPPELRGSETVLLVEDDDQVRRVAHTILVRYGYRVVEAPSADAALAIPAPEMARVDVLLTDVVMPRLGGRELAERLCELRPGLKTIFMSGYTTDIVRDGALGCDLAFVQKPLMPEALVSAIRQVLSS